MACPSNAKWHNQKLSFHHLRSESYDSALHNSDDSFSSNLIGQTAGRMAVSSFGTKNTRPPFEQTKWQPKVGWGRD